jgi:hypothetical protein
VVLFGGQNAHGPYLNDTWTWAGGVWTNITAGTGSPPPCFWASMAYDAATASILLFGGINRSSDYGNDTWSFKAGIWSHLDPATLLPGRHAQEMTYDAADSEMVMFGGTGLALYLNDTWIYKNGDWAPIAPGPHPGARVGPGLTYDTAFGQVVLYGGQPAPDDYYSTWLFSAGVWTQYNVTNSPPNPSNPWEQLIYDPVDNYVLLFYEPQSLGPNMDSWALRLSGGPSPIQASLAANPATILLGQSSTLTTTASGGTGVFAYTYSTLPAGCVNQNSSSISWSPSAAGDYYIGVNVTDSAWDHASATTVLDVAIAGATLTASLAADPGTVVVNQSTTLTVTTNGISATRLTYAYTALPPGCVSADSATLSCSPDTTGTFHPSVEVHDSAGHYANASTTLNVTGPNGGNSTYGSLWIWLVILVIVLAALFLIIVVVRRRKKEPPPAPNSSAWLPGAATPPPPPPPT